MASNPASSLFIHLCLTLRKTLVIGFRRDLVNQNGSNLKTLTYYYKGPFSKEGSIHHARVGHEYASGRLPSNLQPQGRDASGAALGNTWWAETVCARLQQGQMDTKVGDKAKSAAWVRQRGPSEQVDMFTHFLSKP